MKALDTNVLARYLVDDDRAQGERAAAAIRRETRGGVTLFVSDVVLAELVWVLTGAYRFSRAEVASTVGVLLRSRQLAFAGSEGIARAVAAYEAGRGDLADYLIRERAREAAAEAVITFDRALHKEDGFEPP